MTRFTVRAAVVFSLALLVTPRPAAAGELPVAPAPRLVEADPFDLTYLPPDCGDPAQPRLLVAVRPSVLFNRPDARKAAEVADEGLRMLSGLLGVTALAGPGFEGLDTILFAGHATVTRTEGEEKPNSLIGFANGMVIRAREEFDWASTVKAWYPDARKGRHRGERIFLVSIPPALANLFPPGADDTMFAAYVPDGRTLVVGPEASVRKLIDRVKGGEDAPVPAGWQDVERAALAVAIEVPDKKVIDKLPGRDVPEAKTAYKIARLSESAVFGVWMGRTTAVRVTLTTADAKSAKQVAKLLRKLHPALEAAVQDSPEGEHEAGLAKVFAGLTASGRVEQQGATVRVTAQTPESLADHLIPLMTELHPSEPVREKTVRDR